MDKKPKVDCGIILFNPEADIMEKLMVYAMKFHKVYVVDNSDTNSIKGESSLPDNVNYLPQGMNIGLPAAYNKILDLIDADSDFLCTLDQDSDFPINEIEAMKSILPTLSSDISIVAPHIIYQHENVEKKKEIVYRRYDITSGSFIRLATLRKLGLKYDENYFIDKFEVDLCMQFIQAGYNVAEYEGAFLYQQLGEDSGHRHPNHSPLRHYYLFRNRFYFNNKFFKVPKRYFLNIVQTMRHLTLILLYEENKTQKVNMLPLATKDYFQNKFGKI